MFIVVFLYFPISEDTEVSPKKKRRKKEIQQTSNFNCM